MNPFPLLLLVVLLACGGVANAQQKADAEISAETMREDVFPRQRVRFPGGVTALPQVEVSNLVGFRPVRMDIYAQNRHAPRPAVLWVHGGGWSRGDSRTSGAYANWPAVLASLSARGFVVASIDYRLSGEAQFPAQIQDVKAGIRYLRTHARELGVDPSRIYIWGGSAGGHLAALAALSCDAVAFAPQPSIGRLARREMEKAEQAKAPPGIDCVQGGVFWYGVFDLEKVGPANVRELLGCDPADCKDAARAASPMAHVTSSGPPMLLIDGTADKTVPPAQSTAMAEALRRAGVPVELVMIPDADHGWLGATPEITRHASLLALRRTFAFFDELAARH